MSAHMLYHMLYDDVGAHEIAVYLGKRHAVRLEHLLYLDAVLIRFGFGLQTSYRIIFLDALQKIIQVVIPLGNNMYELLKRFVYLGILIVERTEEKRRIRNYDVYLPGTATHPVILFREDIYLVGQRLVVLFPDLILRELGDKFAVDAYHLELRKHECC